MKHILQSTEKTLEKSSINELIKMYRLVPAVPETWKPSRHTFRWLVDHLIIRPKMLFKIK